MSSITTKADSTDEPKRPIDSLEVEKAATSEAEASEAATAPVEAPATKPATPKKATAAKKPAARKKTAAKPKKAAAKPKAEKAPEVDLRKLLLDELAALGVKPKLAAAPSGKHVRLLVGETNIAYVDAQTRNGIRVQVRGIALADLPKKGGFAVNKHYGGIVAVAKTEAEIKAAAVALSTAAAKAKEAKKK